MSDSSSVQLYYLEEDNGWGEDMSASPITFNEFRFTSESLTQTQETTQSEEIRSDRQVSSIVRTQVSAGGDAGIELSYGSHDDLMAGALYDDWSTAVNETSLSLTIADDSPNSSSTITDAGSPGGFANVVVGQFIQLLNCNNSPTSDGFYKVTAKASNVSITVEPNVPNPGAVTADVKGSMIKNGTTKKSFKVEKLFSDLSPQEWQLFNGMRIGSMGLSITPGSIINGSFTFQGKNMVNSNASIGSGTPVEVSTADVMNAVDNITDILVNNTAASTDACFTNVEFTIENNLRDQPCVGSLSNADIGLGQVNVTGTIESYFRDSTQFDRFVNFTTTSLSFRAVDAAGNSYVFDFPAMKFSGGEVVAGGNDQDVLTSLTFECQRDATSDLMMAISRFPA